MNAARALMDRFGVDDALIGDLIEQRHRARSAAWLWRQTLAAVANAVVSQITRNPRLAVQAIIVGFLLRTLHKTLWSFLWRYTNPGLGQLLRHGFAPVGLALSWTDMLMAIPGWILIGWIIARFHRATLVVPYVVLTWMLVAPDYWRQATNAFGEARFRPYFVLHTIGQIAFGVSVIGGALWSGTRHAID